MKFANFFLVLAVVEEIPDLYISRKRILKNILVLTGAFPLLSCRV
jgi:hypothetical protein